MACYENIGEAIKRAQRAYDEGGKKLAPSGQSIIQSCAKLEKLGAKQSKRNPILPLSNLAHNEEDLE